MRQKYPHQVHESVGGASTFSGGDPDPLPPLSGGLWPAGAASGRVPKCLTPEDAVRTTGRPLRGLLPALQQVSHPGKMLQVWTRDLILTPRNALWIQLLPIFLDTMVNPSVTLLPQTAQLISPCTA